MKELHCNCFAYVHGHQFGGINPSLLKALGFGNMILALDTPFNAEVLDGGRYGILYEKNVKNRATHMQRIIDNPDQAQAFRDRSRERIRQRFTWEAVTDQYEAMYRAVHRRAGYDEIMYDVATAGRAAGKESG